MIYTEAVMGTIVSIEVDAPDAAVERAIEVVPSGGDALFPFRCVASELRQLTAGKRTRASPILFEAVRFALMVAEETGGAFDPTVGGRMAARGFNRHYLTREVTGAPESDDGVSFRDVEVDAHDRTILLRRPLTLDLGAVAKGLAIDMAARELQPFRNFAIDAGGDLYLEVAATHKVALGPPASAILVSPAIWSTLSAFRTVPSARRATMNADSIFSIRAAARRRGESRALPSSRPVRCSPTRSRRPRSFSIRKKAFRC